MRFITLYIFYVYKIIFSPIILKGLKGILQDSRIKNYSQNHSVLLRLTFKLTNKDKVIAYNVIPFLIDSNTLYSAYPYSLKYVAQIICQNNKIR